MSNLCWRQRTSVVIAPLLILTLLGHASASAQSALGERLPVREVVLDNGLRLLLLPREGAPTISFVMQFAVGGVHERLGTTGIAHLLEHMLFKGTETIGTTNVDAERALFPLMDDAHDLLIRARAAGDLRTVEELASTIDSLEDQAREYVEANEFDRILTRAGAQGLNATTTNESTIYFVELPANRAELFFALESDRMTNPVFREFYSERDVVTEERRMRIETSPGGLLYEAHLAAAFTMHPYGVPVVGYMSDLETLSRRDVDAYYRRYYGPDNAVLAVVGRFDPDEIEGWARHYLEPIPRGEPPPPVLAVEPEQRGERRVEVEWDAEPQLRIGWRVPPADHEDAPALVILASILTGGRTARLHRKLITEDRLAVSVYTSMGPGSLFPQLFQVEATPIYPASPRDLERVVYEEIASLARLGPTDREVERVRNQITAGTVRRIQSNLGLAFQIADSEALFGDWRETFRSAERLNAVTADDVRRVAAQYLRGENRTVATLVRPRSP
ncbi:MAG: pitrilysin family protein [Gemmatimonadetes bacterium]|nr:pitrilysin family protein [Gemmatimonadota bacterium]MDA1104191.1 pitrilysin family protein [Gemmatimonadota bacterium]